MSKSHKAWNKDLTKESDVRVLNMTRKSGMSRRGKPTWNDGLTMETDSRIKKFSEKMKGRVGGMTGKNHKDSTRLQMHYSMLGKNKGKHPVREFKPGHTPWNKGGHHTEASRAKMSKSHIGVKLSKTHANNISKAVALSWADPVQKAKHVRAILKGSHNRPTTEESKLFDFLDILFPGEYKYVGDGKVIVGGKNPDFINVNGKKKIVEMYGDRWHKGQNPQDRIDIFKPYGYDTLIVWDRELNDIEALAEKLIQFNQ